MVDGSTKLAYAPTTDRMHHCRVVLNTRLFFIGICGNDKEFFFALLGSSHPREERTRRLIIIRVALSRAFHGCMENGLV